MGTTLVHPILTSHTHPSPTVSSGTAQERAFCANTNARIRSFEFLRILGQALGLSTSGISQTMSYPDTVQSCLSAAVELSNGLPYPPHIARTSPTHRLAFYSINYGSVRRI